MILGTTFDWLVVWNMNFIFHSIWDNPSHCLIFFKMVKTTNQDTVYTCIYVHVCVAKRPSCFHYHDQAGNEREREQWESLCDLDGR